MHLIYGAKLVHGSNPMKWFTRHGYWARRKKHIDFSSHKTGYQEMRGNGKRAMHSWENPAFYRSLNSTTR